MNMSIPDSPSYPPSEESGSFSEVPTEPLGSSERQLVHEYMSRRQHFLSDYERYNPVQNMHMLANHVFDLSENIFRLRGEFTSSRRMLDIVATNQREENESIRAVGDDLTSTRDDLSSLRREMDEMRRETQQGFAEIKTMLAMLAGVRA